MKTIIIGAGFTGVQLARALLAEKHRVTLIDPDAERVRDVASRLDCAVVQAGGNDLEVLEKAGLADAQTLIAVSASDEVNMVACALADALHPEILKIARVRNRAYYTALDAALRKFPEMRSGARRPPFGIDWMVNPDVEVASAIGRAIDWKGLKRVAVVGAGSLGLQIVANELARKRPDQELMLIDDDLDRCRAAAERFAKVRVVCGDMADEDFIHDENLGRLDLVVTATDNYERNIVTAAYLEKCGVPLEIVLTATTALSDIATRLGVEVMVPMRDTIVRAILGHVRSR